MKRGRIYRYTTDEGYWQMEPEFAYDGTDYAEACRILARMAYTLGWPAGEYHADIGDGMVPVVEVQP